MRISDWSSDVCSSDLGAGAARDAVLRQSRGDGVAARVELRVAERDVVAPGATGAADRDLVWPLGGQSRQGGGDVAGGAHAGIIAARPPGGCGSPCRSGGSRELSLSPPPPEGGGGPERKRAV